MPWVCVSSGLNVCSLANVQWYRRQEENAPSQGVRIEPSQLWASQQAVADALGVTRKALEQWIAPGGSICDVSEYVLMVPNKDLPPKLKANRGRKMISAAAVSEYLTHIHKTPGPKRRSRLNEEQRESLRVYKYPHVELQDDFIFLDDQQIPKHRFIDEWLRPLTSRLGYSLESADRIVNVCQVKRTKKQ